jgi:cytochrome c peroxidase
LTKNNFIYALVCFLALFAFRSKVKPSTFYPKYFPKPVYDFSKNPLTDNKILLGRALFYEPSLSRNNTISCASCHSPFSAFAHIDHDLSHGIDDKIGFRNAPALQNLAWQKTFMRDGSIHHLDLQALAPISNKDEMDETIAHVVTKLQNSDIYPQLYYRAFDDSIITGEHTLKAISQFMLTLVSCDSKYDKVRRKETTFNTQEEKGYALFKEKCGSCHTEPLFTNDNFENNGLSVDTNINDFGRMRVSLKAMDSLKFKVPSLRNIEYTYPYMHDGRFKKLGQVLQHYSEGIIKSNTLSRHLQKPLSLSSNEKVDLVAFLLTLSDTSFIFNKQFHKIKMSLA